MSNSRIASVEKALVQIESRIAGLESQVQTMAMVVAATADDTLRTNLAIEELSMAGKIPPLPWNLATLLVEIHHAKLAKDNQDIPAEDGVTLDQRVQGLMTQISALRQELHHGIPATTR